MRTFLLAFFLFCLAEGQAQSDLTGRYGYSEPHSSLLRRHKRVSTDERGYHQTLLLLRLNATTYRFWLYANRGYPSYNSGEIDDTIRFQGGQALYQVRDDSWGLDCQLRFTVKGNKVVVEQTGDCGFGANVTAGGDYPRLTTGLTSKDIAFYGQMTPDTYLVSVAKATIYTDNEATKSTTTHFIKGDKVYAISDEPTTILVRHVTSRGKYIEGYLRKSDLKLVPAGP